MSEWFDRLVGRRHLEDFLGDGTFARYVCEVASFATTNDIELATMLDSLLNEAYRLDYRTDQLFKRLTDTLPAVCNSAHLASKVSDVSKAVQVKSKEWKI